jgi:branched-subunit amino acid aminotransferase/4-amino-4-deoxychorismate lyase
VTTVEIDGIEPDADRLWATVSGYGHFTAMQVRGGRTRGLALHMRRLGEANRAAFGVGIDPDRIRELIRHALRDTADASVRVYLYDGSDRPVTMVTVKPPAEIATPQRLGSVRYQRPKPHIKHASTDQGLYREQAQRDGSDDALLTADDGTVSETTFANIGFFQRSGVVWPDAPMLHGITMQLLDEALPKIGVPVRRARVRVTDISSFDGAFLSNARGVAAVTSVDDIETTPPTDLMDKLEEAYGAVPWDPIV